MSGNDKLRGLLRFAAGALAVVMVIVLARAMRRDGPAALDAWRAAHVQWRWVVLSVVCGFTGHAFYVAGWRRLLKDVSVHSSFWSLVRIFLVSNLGRYLPAAKAWQMGIVAMMAAEYRLPATLVAGSSLIQGIVGTGVGALVLFASGGTVIGISSAWLLLSVVGFAVLLAAPRAIRISSRIHGFVAQRVSGIESVTAATMWTLIWTAAASWVLWGIALYCLAIALLPAPGASLSAYIAAWTGSFLAGIIAVVSPAGLGAREGMMQAVLSAAGVQASEVLVLVIVTRAWVTVLDVVPAVIVLLTRRKLRK